MKNRKLRVMISALSAVSYGGESYFRSLIPALGRYGSDLECLLLTRDGRFDHLCRISGNITPIACKLPLGFRHQSRFLWEQMVIPRLINNNQADVFYSANNLALLSSPRPCVIAIQNMEAFVTTDARATLNHKFRNRILRFFSLLSVRRANRIVAVSKYVRDCALANGAPSDRVDLVYPGIDEFQEGQGISQVKNSFVFAAAKFIRYANLEFLFRGFAEMRSLGYRGRLIFAGGSFDLRYERELKSLIKELRLFEHVTFLGYIPRDEVLTYMQKSEAFLFPSMLEACPFSLLEGMRQGAAIVATTSPPMRELCEDAALYSSPFDSNAFGTLAYEVVVNHQKNVAIRERALRRARNFTWKSSVEQLVNSWEKAACTCC